MTTEHSGSGDLNRSLELLWDFTDKPARGRKPGLTLDRIVGAAVTVADAEGLDAVSMRRVATELGGGTMSLYRYVPGKAELLDLMLDHVISPTEPSDVAPAGGWRAALERYAAGCWELYLKHPWVMQVDQTRPVLGPNALAGLESTLSEIRDLDMPDAQKISLLVLIDGHVSSCARTAVQAIRAEQRTGVSDEEFWTTQGPILEKAMATGRYPMMAALAEDSFGGGGIDQLTFGLRLLLDGLEGYLTGRDVIQPTTD